MYIYIVGVGGFDLLVIYIYIYYIYNTLLYYIILYYIISYYITYIILKIRIRKKLESFRYCVDETGQRK